MKELSTEEKAKAYDEALKRAKDFENGVVHYPINKGENIMHWIFPELRENEDGRIRKWIINEIKIKHHNLDEDDVDFVDKAIAWLENIPYTIDHEKREGFHLGYKAALEKQGETFTKKDVDDAYLKGISDAKNELEKQGGQKPTDEVESITQSYIIPNEKFFQWIYDRLINVHNENPNVDYMLSLKKRIEDMQNPINDDMKEALRMEYEKGRADVIADTLSWLENCWPKYCSNQTIIEGFKEAIKD